MRTFCSHCFQAYDVEEELLNQNVQCSVCRKNFIVVDHDNAVVGQGQFETYCNHCWQRHIVPDKNYNGMITCFNCNKKFVRSDHRGTCADRSDPHPRFPCAEDTDT